MGGVEDGTPGQSLIQVGKFGTDLDLDNGRIRLRFLFVGKDATPPDPTLSGQDGLYIDNVVLRWIEKRPGSDVASSCGARDARLQYSSLHADDTDPAGGNNNGQVDPGETVVLNVRLLGAGTDSSRGITGTLTTDQPAFVTILDGNATWPDTVPGQVQLSASPHLRVAVSPATPCGTVIGMTLTLDHNGTSAKSVVTFPLRIGAFSPAGTPAIKEDFEAGQGGWARNASGTDTATDGLWEWVVPRLTCFNEGSGNPPAPQNSVDYKTVQPGTDADPGTVSGHAWITENLLVQVIKDPIGSKGARLTTFITIPSRYLVLLPRGNGVGVSSRIEDEAERERLKALLAGMLPSQPECGFIIRTAAEGAGAEALRADIAFLVKVWALISDSTGP